MGKPVNKIGLFLCRCATNIDGFLDLDEIARWANLKDDVGFVESHNLLCSPDGKKFVEETIKKNDAGSVVIAACSPKMHEKTFREVAENAGINMAMVHMANIRDQCAWVTKNKEQATEKSKSLIHAAIRRSFYHEELKPRTMECLTDVVIIGGGIAGIEAALMAAKDGRQVTIIEKNISLGGNIIKTEDIAPTMECTPCVLAPRLSEIKEFDTIHVITNAEVVDVKGFLGKFTITIEKKARFVDDTCIGCEACFEVCPVSVKSDFHLGLGERKAIYTLFPGSLPDTAAIDQRICKHFLDQSCNACLEACPFGSINFNDKDEVLLIEAGAIVVATGFDNVEPSGKNELGYGIIDNVYTTPEFERIISSNGPYEGEIKLRNGKTPSSVAVVHCAFSLEDNELPYCSGICCMNAAKVGAFLRKKIPDIKVYNIHNRLVFDGPETHAFYKKQIEDGTKFLQTDELSSIIISRNNEKISVTGKGFDPLSVDMVVLSTGMKPAKGTMELASLLNIDLSQSGFVKPDHAVLHATGTSIEGIYSAGCCASPCNASTSITRAQAAIGDIFSKLIPGKEIELEVLTASIDSEICSGCKLCIPVCSYKAIDFDDEHNVSVVNEVICRGCGTCAATCPSGAATAKHYTNEQIYAEIGGIIHE